MGKGPTYVIRHLVELQEMSGHVSAYQVCEHTTVLFSVMIKLGLCKGQPMASLEKYIHFYWNIKEGVYGNI